MTGGRRFDVSELQGPETPGDPATPGDPPTSDSDLADVLAMARELEALASADLAVPSSGFDDLVMAAISAEPLPRLVARPSWAVRGAALGAGLLAFRQAWALAFSGGRPFAVRAQAVAVVAMVLLAAGLLTTATAVTVGNFMQGRSPAPSVAPVPVSYTHLTLPTTERV